MQGFSFESSLSPGITLVPLCRPIQKIGATSGGRHDIWTFVASHSFFIYLKFPQPVAKDPLQAVGSQLRTAFPLSHPKPLAVKIGPRASQG